MKRTVNYPAYVLISTFFAILTIAASAYGQGATVTGVGAVNRSMGGAGTAAPLEAIGALHWNPASISALPTGEVSFAMEGLLANVELTSTVGGVSNTTSGEAGVSAIPSVGWVHHVSGTPITVGLGFYGIAGFRNNMPADPANPLLAAGPLFADAEIFQIAPTFSYRLTDRLSIGIAPTLTGGRLMLDPLGPSVITPAATPGTGNRVHWGGGVQAGIYYITENCWHFGFTVKSPQWFEDFRFFTPGGVVKFDLDYPLILSLGTAYSGFDRWIFAADVRFFNFDDTNGLSDLGWRNVFSAAFGAQYCINDWWRVRCGYNFNQNPIHASDAFFNVATPLIQDQNIAAGVSCRLACNVDFSLAYVYLVNNKVTGPLPSPPFGPADTLTHEIDAHSLAFGVTVRY